MTQSMVVTIMQDAIMTVLKCSIPMMGAALVIGVIISIFQAATQINEQTLAFVPKIIITFIALLLTSGYILTQLTEFFQRLQEYMAQIMI